MLGASVKVVVAGSSGAGQTGQGPFIFITTIGRQGNQV